MTTDITSAPAVDEHDEPGWLPLPHRGHVGIVIAVVIGVVARFVADTPLWLDEALTVNIADLPVRDIDDALRQDGHPPLYYLLLNAWMALFGQSDVAVRALSGVVSVAALPLAFVAGRRIAGPRTAWLSLALFAASPFAIRYATEARMYSLLSLLALALWLLVDDARTDPRPVRLAAITLVGTALCWTHYWSFWLLAAFGGWALLAAVGRAPGYRPDAGRRVAGALVLSGLLFVPWVPALLDQLAHTGTPWGDPSRPAELVVLTVFELGGGPRSEAQLMAMAITTLAAVGIFGRPGDDKRIELDVRVASPARELAGLAIATMTIGLVVNLVTGSTFQPRYAAVVVPMVLLLAARGLACFRGPALGLVATVVVAGGLGAGVVVSSLDRSQGEHIAGVIDGADQANDVVVFCPDQLGPSTARYLERARPALTFPDGDPPVLVDWRDYADRVDAADPTQFITDIEADHDGTVWVVMATSYRTLEGVCEQILTGLTAIRPGELVVRPDTDFYEPAALYRFDP